MNAKIRVVLLFKHRMEVIPNKLAHDGTWKESADMLGKFMENSAFSFEFAGSISEGACNVLKKLASFFSIVSILTCNDLFGSYKARLLPV